MPEGAEELTGACPAVLRLPPGAHGEEPVEHAVLSIKPDGWGDPGVEAAARDALAGARLAVVAERDVELTAEDVMELSHRPDAELIDYLVSAPSRVFVVRGPAALAATNRLKRTLRRHFGVEEQIRNLFHTVDAGKELAEWLGRFFPHCDEPSARGTADQFWLPPDTAALREGLAWAARVHPHGIAVPVLAHAALDGEAFAALREAGCRWLGLLDPQPYPGLEEFESLRYHPLDATGRPRGAGLPALGRTRPRRGDYGELMRTAAAAGFRSFLANSEVYSFFELDLLDEAGVAAGMIALAGSGAGSRPFAIANSSANQRVFAQAVEAA